MNIKTVVTAGMGIVAGLGLAMGVAVYAQDTTHMGNTQTTGMMGGNTQAGGMMGQPIQKNIPVMGDHGSMHGKTARQGMHGNMNMQPVQSPRPLAGPHAANGQTLGNFPCHSTQGSPKT